MKVVHAMERRHFRTICEMGAQAVIGIADELEARGIPSGHTGNVLIVAMAGAIKGGDMTLESLAEGLEALKDLWVEEGDGYVLKLPSLYYDDSADERPKD